MKPSEIAPEKPDRSHAEMKPLTAFLIAITVPIVLASPFIIIAIRNWLSR